MTETAMTEGSREIPVAAVAGALFCVILIYLALQMRSGNDPAVGAGTQTAAPRVPRQVVVRRVVIRTIVEDLAPTGTQPAGAAPTTRVSEAVAAPAASAPTAAPAPAPAPVVSRGS
jgi:hypothetical protein